MWRRREMDRGLLVGRDLSGVGLGISDGLEASIGDLTFRS